MCPLIDTNLVCIIWSEISHLFHLWHHSGVTIFYEEKEAMSLLSSSNLLPSLLLLVRSWWYIFEHNYLCLCVAHISPFQCTKRPSGKVACALSLKFLLSASHLWNLEDVQQQISFQCLEKSDRWAGLFPSDCCPVSAFSVHWNHSNILLCLPVYPQLHSLVQMCCYDALVF